MRLFLSVCIVVSLLPLQEVHELDGLFLLVFGVEFLLRAAVVFHGAGEDADERGWRWPTRGALLLLSFDALALVSFLPLVAHDTPWMRLLRVIRLVALLSYWAPVMQDLRAVLLRRERSRQVLVMGAMVGLLSFIGALALEQLEGGAGVVDYDEDGMITGSDRKFFVHLWWAFRQIQDPGNMLAAPGSVAAVIVKDNANLLVNLHSATVNEPREIVLPRGHNVNFGAPVDTMVALGGGSLSRRWLRQLIENARRMVLGSRYVLVGRSEERPAFLRRPELAHIVYRPVTTADQDFMVRADVARAQRVVILADLEVANPDADTIHALLMIHDALRGHGPAPGVARVPGKLRASDGHHTQGRGRLLIAEILDERNLPAAWAAIDYGAGEIRAFVVLIERLVGLLLACVARIDGIGPVLEELLTTHGHELYTCFFAMPELTYHAATPPKLPGDYAEALALMRARAFVRPPRRFSVPVGLIYEEADAQGFTARRVVIGNEAGAGVGERAWTGFVALAPNFGVVRDLCEDLRRGPDVKVSSSSEPEPEPEVETPGFVSVPELPLRRILVCGFRPATVGLLEALVLAEPQAQILVLLDDEAALQAATERFREHRSLGEYRMLTLSPGSFVVQDDGTFVYQPRLREAMQCGRVRLAVGDRSSLLQFVDLPHGFGHAGDLDLALLLATRREDGDARTTQSLLALEVARSRGGRSSGLRVIAEVVDAELCARLRRRARLAGDDKVQVYALESLRAAFLFQSVLVPAFNLVYGELMGPWGQSFARKRVAEPGRGTCSFQQLSRRCLADGELLLGVERRRPDGQVVVDLAGGDGNGRRIDLGTLEAIWVLAADPSEAKRGSCVDGPVA